MLSEDVQILKNQMNLLKQKTPVKITDESKMNNSKFCYVFSINCYIY